MTGYGKFYLHCPTATFLIELHSVNRKSLEIQSSIPKELLCLDVALRRHLSERVKRGTVLLRITQQEALNPVLPSFEKMKTLYDKWALFAKKLGYCPQEAISFSMLMEHAIAPSACSLDKIEPSFESDLLAGFDQALTAFIEMKEEEGRALVVDIEARLQTIDQWVRAIGARTLEAPNSYFTKLKQRFAELEMKCQEDHDRLMRELVIFTDRVDISEEITRLLSHIKQVEALLASKKVRVGRELDFLVQEMNREANTIAAKSQDLEIAQSTVAIKSELEKIREQLQNIE